MARKGSSVLNLWYFVYLGTYLRLLSLSKICKTIAITDKPSLITYTGKYFESISNAPQNTETFASPQQPINLEVDPSITAIHHKQKMLATIHERLGHLRFDKLKLLARALLNPRVLSDIFSPTCQGCAYVKYHCHIWCPKTRKISIQYQNKPPNKSGKVIIDNQLVIPNTGLIPTHKGNATVARCFGSTMFVDNYFTSLMFA